MRVLAFTDIHGSFRHVHDAISAEAQFDVIVLGGDLTTFGTPEDVRGHLSKLRLSGKPVILVAGNMDPPGLEEEFLRLGLTVNGKGKMIGPVGFFGVSAAPLSPLHTPYEISEEEIASRAEAGWNDIRTAETTVFVPHAPPKNTALDRTFAGIHVGSSAVRIERRQPNVAICGHIHESRGIDRIGRTAVVNCGPAAKGQYAVITLGTRTEIQLRG